MNQEELDRAKEIREEAINQYSVDPFKVTGTSRTYWGLLETKTIATVIPELDEESLGTDEDMLSYNINNNPSYTVDIPEFDASGYELDKETLDQWISTPKLSFYNANVRIKPDPF